MGTYQSGVLLNQDACRVSGRRSHLPTIHLQSCTATSTLPGLAAADATTTPDSVGLLRMSIAAHLTPSLHSSMPLRTAAMNM